MRNDELDISNDELVNMVLLQGEAIQILIEKVKNLETGIGKLRKNLTDKMQNLKKDLTLKTMKQVSYIGISNQLTDKEY